MNSLKLRLGVITFVSFLYIYSIPTYGQANRQMIAHQHFSKKNYQKVIDTLNPYLESLSKSELMVLGKSYSFLKNHQSAIKIYQSLVAQNQKDYEAFTLLGGEFLTLGKSSEALTHLKEALSINPKYSLAYRLLIQHYEKTNNKYELRLIYEDIISHLGEQPKAILKLCELCASDRLYDQAFKYCQKSISLVPNQPESYIFLGHSYRDTGNLEKATATYKKAAEIFSKSDLAQLSYAKFLEEQKNHLQAYAFYKKAALNNPQSIEAQLGQATTGLELQKFDEALNGFVKICRKDKSAISGFRRAVSSLRIQKSNSEVQKWINKYENSLANCENF